VIAVIKTVSVFIGNKGGVFLVVLHSGLGNNVGDISKNASIDLDMRLFKGLALLLLKFRICSWSLLPFSKLVKNFSYSSS